MEPALDEASLVPCPAWSPATRIAALSTVIKEFDRVGLPRVLRSVADAAVYVYLVRFADGTLESMSFMSLKDAKAERAHDRGYLQFDVSPIVKVMVPRPEVRDAR